MKKVLRVENLDCANCAAKMEEEIKKIDGVQEVYVNFMTQKIKIELDEENCDTIIMNIKKACKKIEPDCTILDK